MIPTSSARMSVNLSPENQQVVNEIMKSDNITDRNQVMDKIVKEYGKKIRGLEPGLIIKTGDGYRTVASGEEGATPPAAQTPGSLQDLTASMAEQIKFKQMQKSLASMEGEGSSAQSPFAKIMNDIAPIFGMKIMQEQLGGNKENGSALSYELQRLRDEIRELKSGYGRPEDSRVQEMQRKMEKMENDRRYEDLLRTMAQSQAGKENNGNLLSQLKVIQDIKGDTEAKLDRARDEYQKTLGEIRDRQIEELRRQMEQAKTAASTVSPLTAQIEKSAQELLMDTVGKGFKAAKGERSTGDMAVDMINGVIERIKEPILDPIGQAMALKMAGPGAQFVATPTGAPQGPQAAPPVYQDEAPGTQFVQEGAPVEEQAAQAAQNMRNSFVPGG